GERHVVEDSQTTVLSGASNSTMTYGIAAVPGRQAGLLSVSATVTDIDRSTIRAQSRVIPVHRPAYYVGLRGEPEDKDQVQLVVTDVDGNAVAGVPISVELEGMLMSERWNNEPRITDTQHCDVTSAKTPVTCTFTYKTHEHVYRAIAHVKDA